MQLRPHPISSEFHSNGFLESNCRIHYKRYFLSELCENPDVHVVTSHHVHNFYASSHIGWKDSLALALLKQVLKNVGLTYEVIFVFIDQTEHEAQDF